MAEKLSDSGERVESESFEDACKKGHPRPATEELPAELDRPVQDNPEDEEIDLLEADSQIGEPDGTLQFSAGERVPNERHIRHVHAALMKKYGENGESVELFSFILDPTSYSRTILNLLAAVHLINEDKLKMTEGEENILLLTPTQGEIGVVSSPDETLASIFSVDYSTWKRMTEQLKIDRPAIPPLEKETAQDSD